MIAEKDIYFQILAYGLDTNAIITPPDVDNVDWNTFFTFCEKQAIVGIGLQSRDKLKMRLCDKLIVSHNLFFQWIVVTEEIKFSNGEK